MPRADAIHLGLMLLALALSYVLPFELLLLSYAVLGPIHYLTEISWLHERGYFLPIKSIALILVLFSLTAPFLPSFSSLGILMWVAFLASAIAIARISLGQRILLLAFVAAVTAALVTHETFFYLVAALLPTLVHVSLFTLVFMIVGAHRAGSKAQAALIVAYLAMIGLILVVPPVMGPVMAQSQQMGRQYFGSIAWGLGLVLNAPDLKMDGRITGLLSFIYTYHYLNWFIKADLIGWRRTPKWRLAAVSALGIAASGLYFYDYALGIVVLLALNTAHVVLEFPLNATSLRQLAGIAAHGMARRAPTIG